LSQLARQWEVREPYRKQQQMEQPAISPRRKITKGEKWLWALGIGILFMLSVVIVSKQAEIYLTNRDISHVQSQIEKVADDNKKRMCKRHNSWTRSGSLNMPKNMAIP